MPQPLKWKSPKILLRRGMKWIDEQALSGNPLTISGLALALKTTRTMLNEYQEREEYREVIDTLKGYCENYAETRLFKATNPSGAIFALKQYGWNDKQELEISGNAKITTIGLILKGIEAGQSETQYLKDGQSLIKEEETEVLTIDAPVESKEEIL